MSYQSNFPFVQWTPSPTGQNSGFYLPAGRVQPGEQICASGCNRAQVGGQVVVPASATKVMATQQADVKANQVAHVGATQYVIPAGTNLQGIQYKVAYPSNPTIMAPANNGQYPVLMDLSKLYQTTTGIPAAPAPPRKPTTVKKYVNNCCLGCAPCCCGQCNELVEVPVNEEDDEIEDDEEEEAPKPAPPNNNGCCKAMCCGITCCACKPCDGCDGCGCCPPPPPPAPVQEVKQVKPVEQICGYLPMPVDPKPVTQYAVRSNYNVTGFIPYTGQQSQALPIDKRFVWAGQVQPYGDAGRVVFSS